MMTEVAVVFDHGPRQCPLASLRFSSKQGLGNGLEAGQRHRLVAAAGSRDCAREDAQRDLALLRAQPREIDNEGAGWVRDDGTGCAIAEPVGSRIEGPAGTLQAPAR